MSRQFVPGSVDWVIAYRDGAFKYVPYVPLPRDPPDLPSRKTMQTPVLVPSNLWNNRIARLIERDGRKCHYCGRSLHIRKELGNERIDDATIDHRVPRSRGGSNDMNNLLLACRKCNHTKEDRSYEDFKLRPYKVKRPEPAPRPEKQKRGVLSDPLVKAVLARFPGAQIVDVREPKIIRGTLAWAIRNGEVDETGRYRKAPQDVPFSESAPARKMTALETAQWLRERAEKKGKKWPLA